MRVLVPHGRHQKRGEERAVSGADVAAVLEQLGEELENVGRKLVCGGREKSGWDRREGWGGWVEGAGMMRDDARV